MNIIDIDMKKDICFCLIIGLKIFEISLILQEKNIYNYQLQYQLSNNNWISLNQI